jgi:hypothetical protein
MNIRFLVQMALCATPLLMGCVTEADAEDSSGELFVDSPLAAGDECDTTAQCQATYGSAANDCVDSRESTSWCSCGGKRCSDAGGGGTTGGGAAPGGGGTTTGGGAPALSCSRIAYSADGNQHDADDWHASPLSLALIARRAKNKLVHFDYNSHLGDSSRSMAATHAANVLQAQSAYGFNRAIFFDDQTSLNGAIDNLKKEINASSASNRLCFIIAGPMEVAWRGIAAAADDKEQYVTVISHSTWNDRHEDTAEMNHTWSDILADFDVRSERIVDQNSTAFRSSTSSWSWLRELDNGAALHRAVTTGSKAGDASDTGMVYYLLTGDERADMREVMAFFGVN